MGIKDFLGAVKSAPSDIHATHKTLAKLKAERQVVESSPPDAQTARAWFLRRLTNARKSAEDRLVRWHTNRDSFAKWSGSTFDGHEGFNVLGLTQTVPNHVSPNPAGNNVDVD